MALRDLLPNGSVRIHFVTIDGEGPAIVAEGVIAGTRLITPGNRYRVACDPSWNALGNFPHTREPQAVTCPECLASADFKGSQK